MFNPLKHMQVVHEAPHFIVADFQGVSRLKIYKIHDSTNSSISNSAKILRQYYNFLTFHQSFLVISHGKFSYI